MTEPKNRRERLIAGHQYVASSIRQNVDNGDALSPEFEAVLLELAARHERTARRLEDGQGRAAR